MTTTLLIIIILLLFVNLWMVWSSGANANNDKTKTEFTKISSEILKLDVHIRDEFSRNRTELSQTVKDNRTELSDSLNSFENKLNYVIKEFNELQKFKFDELIVKQEQLKTETENKLEQIRITVEQKLKELQNENSKKLEEMRVTVDEKLQSTLEKRLSESFNIVSERLKQVHQDLGEMKNLATGVGDLKKVLTNVKTRGILGEIQLGNILENIMSKEQYEENVTIKRGSKERVEFAIKLPGKDSFDNVVYLPIDSKFPIEAYYRLVNAYDTDNKELVKAAIKEIETEIKRCAREIKNKYISPPKTTDFGILFLPTESLYAEVVRQTILIEKLQRDYKIIVTGPTTLAALLNSLQMGFKTLAIQKRSAEVWKVLSAVKTQFAKFGDILQKAQHKINKASEDIDELVGIRTRVIQSKLKTVEELPENEADSILGSNTLR